MRVHIFRPAKSAAQSGLAGTYDWLLQPENETPRLPEPVKGWLCVGDTVSGLRGRLRFPSAEAAVAFAKNKGWDVMFHEPNERRVAPRNYLDNFRIVRPQDEERATGNG